MKKLFSLFLSVAFCLSMSMSAFATDGSDNNSNVPEGVKKTDVICIIGAGDDAGIQPLIWGETEPTVSNAYYTSSFAIPDRYFGYDFTAVSSTNPNGIYSVSLLDSNLSVIYKTGAHANGEPGKGDWINVNPGQSYRFRINNSTGSSLTVHITYYSWK